MTECWSKATRRRANKRFVDDAERRFAIERAWQTHFWDFDQTQSIRIRIIIEEARTVVKVVYAAFGARLLNFLLFVDDDYDGTTFKYSIVTS